MDDTMEAFFGIRNLKTILVTFFEEAVDKIDPLGLGLNRVIKYPQLHSQYACTLRTGEDTGNVSGDIEFRDSNELCFEGIRNPTPSWGYWVTKPPKSRAVASKSLSDLGLHPVSEFGSEDNEPSSLSELMASFRRKRTASKYPGSIPKTIQPVYPVVEDTLYKPELQLFTESLWFSVDRDFERLNSIGSVSRRASEYAVKIRNLDSPPRLSYEFLNQLRDLDLSPLQSFKDRIVPVSHFPRSPWSDSKSKTYLRAMDLAQLWVTREGGRAR